MINIEPIPDKDRDPNADGIYLMSRREWNTNSAQQMFSDDDGVGFPIIAGREKMFKVHGFGLRPLNPMFDGVIWYAK